MSEAPTVLLSRVGVAGSADGGAATVEVPKSIGPVRLIRQLGAGAMGVVWLGRHELLARDVAVKFLLSPGSGPGEGAAFDAFVQGARAAAAVRHPGMTAVHDAGATAGTQVPYIVMEFVDGPTLADVMRHGPLPLPVVRTVLAELCAAVNELHDHDLVHRDIKPPNIMVNHEGAAVLTDFGLACPLGGDAWQAGARRPIAGTPTYMAPEMFQGEVSARTDIYAIGATAFELLTGRPVYTGGLEEVRAAASAGVVARGLMEEKGAPGGVIDAVERAMNKDGMFRPKTARRLGELFDQAFEASGIPEASAEAVQQVAFPGGMVAPASPLEKPRSSAVAATMFDLVSEKAAEKRRSAPSLGAAGSAPEAAAGENAAPPVEAPAAVLDPRPSRAPRPGEPPAVKGRAPRICAAVPVAWGKLLLSAAVAGAGMAAVALAVHFMLTSPGLAAHQIAAGTGALEPAAEPVVVDGHTFGGTAPDLLVFLVSGVFYSIPFLVAAAPVMVLYHHLAFTRGGAWGRCEPVCGWCGHSLRGLKDGRCPECGRSVEDRGSAGDRPPAGRRWGRFLRYGLGLVAFAIAAGAGAGLASLVFYVFEGRPQSVALNAAAGVVGAGPALLVYHFVARRKAMLTGVARCGRCGSPARDLEGGHCAVCEQRERAPGSGPPAAGAPGGAPGKATLPARPGSADRTAIPWVLLICLAALGSVIMSMATRMDPPWGRASFWLAEQLSSWNPQTTPRESYGRMYPGLPSTFVRGLAYVVAGPPMFVVLGLMVMEVYHRLAFRGRAPARGGAGMVCGWCGYALGGSERCPECGRTLRQRPGRGDRAPAQRWSNRLRAYGLAAAAFVGALLISIVLVKVAISLAVRIAAPLEHLSTGARDQIFVAIVGLATFLVSLVVYHWAAARTAWLDGVPRCGGCGARVTDALPCCGGCGAAAPA